MRDDPGVSGRPRRALGSLTGRARQDQSRVRSVGGATTGSRTAAGETARTPVPGAEAGTAAADAPGAEAGTTTSYRTFSPRAARSLTALGGGLAAVGALGVAIRATEQRLGERGSPEQVEAVLGSSEPAGWALATLGALLVAASIVWVRPGVASKLVAALAGVAAGGLGAWRLTALDARAQEMAAAARERIVATIDGGTLAYHAGLGWGAWLLALGATMAALGAIVGALRLLDLRRGIGT